MAVTLTKADYIAIENGDYSYINDKGAKYYNDGDYENAIEYYRLAGSMGCVTSISNLGYCYMYARSIPKNMDLAVAYFKIAAQKNNIDALYKLGNIYKKGADGIDADAELSIYYYKKAIDVISEFPYEDSLRYPSLFFSVAKEMMPNGMMLCDLQLAFEFLDRAKTGYEIELQQGIKYHQEALNAVIEAINDECFDEIRTHWIDDDDDFDDDETIKF